MKRKILGLLAVGMIAGSMPARAAMITELFQVTLPSASGVYAAGHVFEITVTYDDAGTSMRIWNDGLNGIGQLGSGDDDLNFTYGLSENPDFTLLSDAQVSISGLAALPTGTTPLDNSVINYAWFFHFGDPSTSGYWQFSFLVDDLYFFAYQYGPEADSFSSFGLSQYFVNTAGNFDELNTTAGGYGFITRSSVLEPGTLALLGLGLLGLGLTRRRKLN